MTDPFIPSTRRRGVDYTTPAPDHAERTAIALERIAGALERISTGAGRDLDRLATVLELELELCPRPRVDSVSGVRIDP